jgi:hypothetical protein
MPIPFIFGQIKKKYLYFLDGLSTNNQILNFLKIRSVGAELFHVDGQTDTLKLIITFSNFFECA